MRTLLLMMSISLLSTVSFAASTINFPIQTDSQSHGYRVPLYGAELMSENSVYSITCKITNTTSTYYHLSLYADFSHQRVAKIFVNDTPIESKFYLKPGTSIITIENAELGRVENVGNLDNAVLSVNSFSYPYGSTEDWKLESCEGFQE